MEYFDVILKPVITELSLKEAKDGRYTFFVSANANKTAIKNAVQKHFNVDVVMVSSEIRKGKTTRTTRLGKKVVKFKTKKARVQLKKGQKISIFEEGDKKK